MRKSIVALAKIMDREETVTQKAGHCVCCLTKIHIKGFGIWIVYVGSYLKCPFDLRECFLEGKCKHFNFNITGEFS